MKPRGVPRPASWLSAGALYVFGLAMNAFYAFAIPFILELMHHSPRLGWLAFLLLWVAPMGWAAAGVRVAHGVLNVFDPGGKSGGVGWPASLWAGLFAWSTMLLVSATAGLIMIVLDPPPMDPGAFLIGLLRSMSHAFEAGIEAAIWIVLTAYVYELQKSAAHAPRSPASQ